MSAFDSLVRALTDLFGRSRPVRFVLIGLVNTAFSFGLYVLLLAAGFSIPLASGLALMAGIVFSFTTQGLVVFRHATLLTFARFVVGWIAVYGFNLALIYGFLRIEGMGAGLAGALAIAPVTVASYLVQRNFVFRRSTITARTTNP